jgi:ankyrin repeat protein
VEVEYTHSLRGHYAAEQPPPLAATALYYAVFCGFSELAKWLITTHGEDVNAKCYYGRTPLHVASQEDTMHVLLDHGAHVNAQEFEGWTPLHFASKEGNLKAVQLLLEHEADLNARSEHFYSPIWLASEWGRLEVVRLLLSHGADGDL